MPWVCRRLDLAKLSAYEGLTSKGAVQSADCQIRQTLSLVPGFFSTFLSFCARFVKRRHKSRVPVLTCDRTAFAHMHAEFYSIINHGKWSGSSVSPVHAAAILRGRKKGRGVASQSHTGIWLEGKGKFEIWKVKISGVLLLNVRNVQECTWHTRLRERWQVGGGGYLYAENRQWHSARGHWYPESRWEGEPMQISESKGKWHFAVGCWEAAGERSRSAQSRKAQKGAGGVLGGWDPGVWVRVRTGTHTQTHTGKTRKCVFSAQGVDREQNGSQVAWQRRGLPSVNSEEAGTAGGGRGRGGGWGALLMILGRACVQDGVTESSCGQARDCVPAHVCVCDARAPGTCMWTRVSEFA